jgi:3-hydroxymyristoyl/3-hydroxydecanoyl-(acyl carrier protein) dehydratase
MIAETRCLIAAGHPSLAGHFPGNPVAPGVVILDEVLRALAAWRPECRPVGLPAVKFLEPLRPAQAFTIRLAEAGPLQVRFECRRDDGQILVQGQVALTGDDPGGYEPAGRTVVAPPLRPK